MRDSHAIDAHAVAGRYACGTVGGVAEVAMRGFAAVFASRARRILRPDQTGVHRFRPAFLVIPVSKSKRKRYRMRRKSLTE